MFNTSEGYSLSDIAAVTNGNGGFGFGDGNGWWVILLFLFAFGGWGNNGWGNGSGGSTAVTADIGYNFDMHDVSSGIRDLASGVSNGFYGINSSLLTGFSGTQAQIANSGFQTIQAINANTIAGLQNTDAIQLQAANHAATEALANCQLGDKIDADFATLNYNIATEACADRTALANGIRDIIDNNNANTRQVLDFLTQDRIAALTNENQALKGQISQSEQNAYLINALRPNAIPAYQVPNPYASYGYGYGCGCACNGFMG